MDILNWKQVLDTNGILCGHDYGHPDWKDVANVVDALVPNARRVPETNIWTTEEA